MASLPTHFATFRIAPALSRGLRPAPVISTLFPMADLKEILIPEAQWLCLLMHLGSWQGSFARLDPMGELQTETPTIIQLAGEDNNQAVRQTLNYYQAGATVLNDQTLERQTVLNYSTLNRGVLFFGNGAFSQGSLQFSPMADFGGEFGFIQGDRRLRLVQIFAAGGKGALSGITLIRERSPHSNSPEQPPLTVDTLLGCWKGQAVTLYPDWRSPDAFPTELTLDRSPDQPDQLRQRLVMPSRTIVSTATIQTTLAGSRLLFGSDRHATQVLLLPDGASCTTPLACPAGQHFFLEAGWLVAPDLRQRLIRRYDAQGGWQSLTLVVEQRVT